MRSDARATWRKSSRSGTSNCVELRRVGDAVELRDSKDRSGPVLSFTPAEFEAFIAGTKAGEFDNLI